MTTLNISLPDDLQAFIEQQIATGSYGTASDYLSHLLMHYLRFKRIPIPA
jgi:antitoxin ParD1/3/4